MSTVNGKIKDKGLAVRQKTALEFKCTDGASIVGDAVCIPQPIIKAVTNTSGVFTVELAPGNYELWIGGKKYCTLAVPASGTVRLEEISDIAAVQANVFSSQLWLADDGQLVRVSLQFNGAGYQFLYEPQG